MQISKHERQFMKIFVPGRVCLFGEHSDWAGGYRRVNADIDKGHALVVGTNQGIHADVKPCENKLILHCTLDDGTKVGPFEVEMNRKTLLEEAEKGNFFSYAAGVAYQVMTHYSVGGLEIDNYHTDLPVKKGLSSSAAICVLVARAFNKIYDLKMTVRGEMEYAYQGEITTPSRCGRLDQACAYGNRPVLLSFDGDRIDVDEFNVAQDLNYVIVDLCAGKNTKKILRDLNKCYPFPEGEIQQGVHKYLGTISSAITKEAIKQIEDGNIELLGKLMTKAQKEFDQHLCPACPDELTAPALHKLINYPAIQPYILGGKGIGSQGDGSAQILTKDKESQKSVIKIVEQQLGMSCMKLTVNSNKQIRKAVIPAAGFGTRMFPATKAVKKEMFPVIDRDGRAKPVIMAIVEEVFAAGIEEIAIITQESDITLFREFFSSKPTIEHYNKLSQEDKEYVDYIGEFGRRITIIPQISQDGFGDAVYCSKNWVNNEAFLLLLGDHLYASETSKSCTKQILDIYEKMGKSIVGLQETPAEQVRYFGCVTGNWEKDKTILEISQFAEKPSVEYAKEYLKTEGLPKKTYLGLFGQYVLTPGIFELLQKNIETNSREGGEFQLTSCLDTLRKLEGFFGYIVKGRRFDIGNPEAYRETIIEFSKSKV
jgi:UTP-glucose-1-phosphate uridylyltransferase/mevalonate kinase